MTPYEMSRHCPESRLAAIPVLLGRYLPSLLKMLPQLGVIQGSVGDVMDKEVRDPWVRRLIDLECFLLSGLKAHGTIAPEVAFMLGNAPVLVWSIQLGEVVQLLMHWCVA
jgi:hypothetical protein